MPVQVAVYQLAHESALARATFDELWADAAGALGESLLERRELTLFPGSTQTIDWPLRSETRVLAAVALFREPRGRDWTMSYALTAADPNKACPAAHPRIQLWLDGMKIRDGAGRPGDTH